MNIRGVSCLAGLVLCLAPVRAAELNPARFLGSAPLRFEPAAQDGKFVARGFRSAMLFESDRATVGTGDKALTLRFDGANRRARLEGLDKLGSTTGVFHGSDPSQWRAHIANYSRLKVHDLYRGIDAVYYGNSHELEYDLVLAPGADARRIRLRFDGEQPMIDAHGSLVASFVQKRPVAYQIAADGAKVPVESGYRRNRDGSFGITVGRYDHTRELIIDPTVSMAFYLFGLSEDVATVVGHDAKGFIYVAGTTHSPDFLTYTPSADSYKISIGGTSDAFLVKIDPNANAIVYASFFGGAADEDVNAMAVASNGVVYLTGSTSSGDFPVVNGVQTTLSGTSDAYVMQIDTTLGGTNVLTYSTYLGGTKDESGEGIALDKNGRIVVCGITTSSDFSIAGGFQASLSGSQDGFLAILNPTQSANATLVYSTLIGGSDQDTARDVIVAPDNTLWVAGGTFSSDFPLAGLVFRKAYIGDGDAYMIHIDLNQNAIVWGTYLGGTGIDEAKKIVLDAVGRLVVTGYTVSQDFPTTSNAIQTQYGGNTDAFLVVLDPSVTTSGQDQLIYSTYFGGSDGDIGYDLKLDPSGNIYAVGLTMSAGLPASGNALQSKYPGAMSGFILGINPQQPGTPIFSSYFGGDGIQAIYGLDITPDGTLYIAGFASGPVFSFGDFSGPSKQSGAGDWDAFVLGFKP